MSTATLKTRRGFSSQRSNTFAVLFISGSYALLWFFRARVRSSPKLIFATGALASVWCVLLLSVYSTLRTSIQMPSDERRRRKPLGWFAALLSGSLGGLLGLQFHPICLTVSWLFYAVWLWELQTPIA